MSRLSWWHIWALDQHEWHFMVSQCFVFSTESVQFCSCECETLLQDINKPWSGSFCQDSLQATSHGPSWRRRWVSFTDWGCFQSCLEPVSERCLILLRVLLLFRVDCECRGWEIVMMVFVYCWDSQKLALILLRLIMAGNSSIGLWSSCHRVLRCKLGQGRCAPSLALRSSGRRYILSGWYNYDVLFLSIRWLVLQCLETGHHNCNYFTHRSFQPIADFCDKWLSLN